MPHFPVTNSTLSAAPLGQFIQQKYALRSDVVCQLIRAGINDTYLVKNGSGKFVFRVYSLHWRTRREIEAEIKLLLELQANEIAVSYPLPDAQQNYIQVLPAPEGDRVAVLFTYAPGEKLHLFSEEIHFRIGALMARIHAVTENKRLDRVDYTPDIILVNSLQQLSSFLSADAPEMHFMQSMQQHLLDAFRTADTTQMREGIVHLDIWFDNLNITPEGQVTIFDFDFCGNGWLALDIAYYVMQLHNIEKYEPEGYEPKVAAFLKGYESVQAISAEEKRLLPMLGVSLYFFYLGVQCQRYENWSNSFLSENYLKRFINGLVKRYAEIYKIGL